MTFFLTFLFMFMVFWRPQEWLWPWMFGWPVLDVIAGAAMLSLFFEVNQGQLRIPKQAPQVFLILGLFFAALVSHVPHTYFGGILLAIPPMFKLCGFTLLLICVLDRPIRLRRVAWLFVVMACLMAIHALLQKTRGYGFADARPIAVRRPGIPFYTRSLFFGIFGDPNDLAQILATSIPFAFALTWRRSIFGFLLGCGVTWLLVAAILATHSRGGMVALATVACTMVILLFPPRWLPVLLIVLLAGVFFVLPMASGQMDASARDRVVFWGDANRAFKENPLFGLGYRMFWQVSDDRTAHNAFVLCYTEIGFFGYWFWFCLVQLGMVGAWRTRTLLRREASAEGSWLRRFTGLTMAATMGFVASAYFLSRAFVFPLFFLLALLAALPVVAERFLPEGHPPIFRLGRDVYLWGTLGAAGSVAYIYVSILILNRVWAGG